MRIAGKTAVAVAWGAVALGAPWMPVQPVIVVTGLVVALTVREAVTATHDEAISMLGTALAEATRQLDLQPVLRGVPQAPASQPEAQARLASLPEHPGHAAGHRRLALR
jgi:hypothetical protein